MGIPRGQTYSWSRSRMCGWTIAQSPMMRTTVTLERLKKRGYFFFGSNFRNLIELYQERYSSKFLLSDEQPSTRPVCLVV